MNEKLEEKLMKEFTFMEGVNAFSGEKTGYPVGCECSDGWYDVIYNLCKELDELYKENNVNPRKIQVLQVKEKYGGLRFYTGGLIPGGHDIIDKYESLSLETCEICGKKGETRGSSWLRTLCNKCDEK